MAVYKATLCYPFLNSIDIRTAQYKDYTSQPVQFLTCQIDSSNTEITGYKIRILSSDNKQVFPVDENGEAIEGYISPVDELKISSLGYDSEKLTINSGLNGTTLRIPFFQSTDNKVLNSYNAVYYQPKYLADHVIASETETGLDTKMDDIQYWDYDATTETLTYSWPGASAEDIKANNIMLDSESILIGEVVLVLGSKEINNTNVDISGLYEVTGHLNPTTVDMTTKLVKINVPTMEKQITLTKGKTLHNYTYQITQDGSNHIIYIKSSTGSTWRDISNNNIVLLDSNNSTYKWEITLYQGNSVPDDEHIDAKSIIYSDVNPEWLDMTLSSGKIMGTTPNRIQIASSDDDANGEIYLPEGIDNAPVVLQGKYIEVSGTIPTAIMSGGTRTYVKTYDSVYGHVYPREDTLTTADINPTNAKYCQFFKYSSNPNEILDTDIVNFCFNTPIEFMGYTIETISDQTGQQLISQKWKSWDINSADQSVSVTNRYIAIDISDYSNIINDGDLVLFTGQGKNLVGQTFTTHAYENGVYQINKIKVTPPDTPDDYTKFYKYESIATPEGPIYDWERIIVSYMAATLNDLPTESVAEDAYGYTYEDEKLYQYISNGWNQVTYSDSQPVNPNLGDIWCKSKDTGDRWCLKRVSGYNQWANYLGKIIYCQNGTNNVRSMNMQSLASAGGTLWDINNTASGTSLLYFTQEKPTLLFPQKLTKTFNLYDNINSSNSAHTNLIVDGKIIRVGDIILYQDKTCGRVATVSNNSYTLSDITNVDNGYYYILDGDQYKEDVLKVTDTEITRSWDLHTAIVLHNTSTKTFISPWKTLQNNMKLALLNNKTVQYVTESNPTDPTRWITIKSFNDKIFYITHNELASPLALASYKNDDDTIPWTYDIRSFFKTSDENPFYSYQTPYITLKKNNESYSDLRIVGGSFYFYVRPQYTDPASLEFLVYDQEGGTKNLLTVDYKAQAIVTGRSVKLQGIYNGLGQSAWESYQWILYDEDGNIVQDTGKRYDKDMGVVFLGLSNDLAEDVIYRALLLVENNFGDIITYELILEINPGVISSFIREGGEFTVTYDCSTHSNIVHYKESKFTKEDEDNIYLYSIYRREYDVYQNPGHQIECYYNPEDGLCYMNKTSGPIYHYDTPVPLSTSYVYIDKDTTHTYQFNPPQNGDVSTGGYTDGTFTLTEAFRTYKGQWQPVLIFDNRQWFRDFNIANDRSYQYIIYPTTSKTLEYGLDTTEQTYANFEGQIWRTKDNFRAVQDNTYAGYLTHGDEDTSVGTGAPVHEHWECWSITELIPEEIDIDAPIIKKQYKVDNNNIWLFKYNLETGSQTQNISKEEFATLGRFSKFGFGNKNYESGSVSALIGSELILSSKVAYTERLGKSRIVPLSSNEKAKMLEQWYDFCYSKNPKLLRDIKGRSWIVQLVSNSTTPQNFIYKTPDTVSFEWRQVDTVDNIIIYGDYTNNDSKIKANIGLPEWSSPYHK